MKNIIKLAAILAFASGSVSNAATTTYTWTTGTTATSSGITNSNGVAFQNSASSSFAGPGVIAWGYFNISDSDISSVAQASTLISAFQNWNSGTSTFASAGPGATSNRGTFNFNASARDLQTGGNGAAFQNRQMYVFVGNATTYANSTEFLVLKTTFTFDPAESGPTAFTKTLTSSNATPVFGNSATDVRTTGTDASITPGWSTVAIPEPSSALLLGVGALGLLRRRRI